MTVTTSPLHSLTGQTASRGSKSSRPGLSLSPIRAVQTTVLNRLRDVLRLKIGRAFQIRDGAGYLQDTVVGAGAQALLGHGAFKQALTVGRKFAVGANVAGVHLGVAVEFFPRRGEALGLLLAGAQHAGPDRGRVFRHGGRSHLFVVHRRDVDVDVDAVHERPRDFRNVALDHGRSAVAFA